MASTREKKAHPHPQDVDDQITAFFENEDYELADEDQDASEQMFDETVLPTSPTGFKAQNLDEGIVRLSWNKVKNATGYKLYRNTSANPTVLRATLGDVAHYLDIAGSNTTYHYRIKASIDAVDSEYSADIKVLVSGN